MPNAPTQRMQSMAKAKLIDTITLHNVSTAVDVDPVTLEPVETTTLAYNGAARVNQASADYVTSVPSRSFGSRIVRVWIPADQDVQVNQRVTILACRDSTLVGESGTVLEVRRSTTQAVREFTAELGSTT